MDLNATAYIGAWINWSRGPVLGATLTLSDTGGTALISAVTIFVQLSGTFSWMTICYILHQWRTAQGRGDGLYHQQQAILRNATSDIGTLWRLCKLAQPWHAVVSHSRRRVARLAAVSLLHLLTFMVISVFASQAITIGNETLVSKGACGFLTVPSTFLTVEGFHQYVAAYLDIERNAVLSLQHVQSCNGTANSLDAQCDVFSSNIDYAINTSVPCPFEDTSMCITPDGLALQLDTGLIDSQQQLGINAPAKDRIKYRHRSTCSPLKQAGFVTEWANATDVNISGVISQTFPGQMVAFYDYGPTWSTNHTFWVTNWWDYIVQPDTNRLPPYLLSVTSQNSDDEFVPISNVTTPLDSDLVMLWLQYHGQYIDEVNDPWFTAHRPGANLSYHSLTPNGLRAADNVVNVMGCIHQYQICGTKNTGSSGCSPLMSVNNLFDYTIGRNVLGLNEAQLNTTNRTLEALGYSTMGELIGPLQGSVLVAQNNLVGDVSEVLPDNQWQIEMINLHNVMKTALQRQLVEYAAGPQSDLSQYVVPPQSPIANQQCDTQILRQDNYMNFSLLAVLLIFILGSLLVIIYLSIEPMTRKFYQQGRRNGPIQRLRWQKDDLLQIQRAAYAAKDLGSGWKNKSGLMYSLVPVTDTAEVFDFPEMEELGELGELGGGGEMLGSDTSYATGGGGGDDAKKHRGGGKGNKGRGEESITQHLMLDLPRLDWPPAWRSQHVQ